MIGLLLRQPKRAKPLPAKQATWAMEPPLDKEDPRQRADSILSDATPPNSPRRRGSFDLSTNDERRSVRKTSAMVRKTAKVTIHRGPVKQRCLIIQISNTRLGNLNWQHCHREKKVLTRWKVVVKKTIGVSVEDSERNW